jgi:hypothetical protein
LAFPGSGVLRTSGERITGCSSVADTTSAGKLSRRQTRPRPNLLAAVGYLRHTEPCGQALGLPGSYQTPP